MFLGEKRKAKKNLELKQLIRCSLLRPDFDTEILTTDCNTLLTDRIQMIWVHIWLWLLVLSAWLFSIVYSLWKPQVSAVESRCKRRLSGYQYWYHKNEQNACELPSFIPVSGMFMPLQMLRDHWQGSNFSFIKILVSWFSRDMDNRHQQALTFIRWAQMCSCSQRFYWLNGLVCSGKQPLQRRQPRWMKPFVRSTLFFVVFFLSSFCADLDVGPFVFIREEFCLDLIAHSIADLVWNTPWLKVTFCKINGFMT